MKLHACEPSSYRVLVSHDPISAKCLVGNFWQETEMLGIKGACF